MKVTKLLAVIIISVCFGFSSKANTIDSTTRLNVHQLAKQEISAQITYPEIAVEKRIEGVVSARFVLDNNGNAVIKAINGHPELIESVREQLQHLNVKTTYHKEMVMRFKFKIL